MSSQTTNLKLHKIDLTDSPPDITVLNANWDTLDTAVTGKQATVTGGASTITSSNLTASRALISNSSGKVAVSDVTSTELSYLDGVTSNIQTQLGGKAPSSHNHSASNITSGTLPVSRGGTGATTFDSGCALIGNDTNAVTTRSIVDITNTSGILMAEDSLITANTVRNMLNRSSSCGSSNSSYSTYMARGIAAGTTDMTAGTTALTNGQIYLVYE